MSFWATLLLMFMFWCYLWYADFNFWILHFDYLNTNYSLFNCCFAHSQWSQMQRVYVECKTKRIFCIACLGKKLGSHTEIRKFYRVKKLSKSNQTRYGVSQGYIESRRKRIFCIACLGKKLVFRTEICGYFK